MIVSAITGFLLLGERDLDIRPDQRRVFNDFGLLAFRAGSNKFDDIWGVDCFPLAGAFRGVTGSGRDFFASLTGAFKAV